MTNKLVKTAVFPVGGLGTRFLPATKSMPKEMLPVVDKPLVQYAFEEAKEAGIEKFIFITGRNKNAISNHFDHAYELQKVLDEKQKKDLLKTAKDWIPQAGSIAFVRQQDPLGLGHAILCAKNFLNEEPFLVMLADEMFINENPQRSFITELIKCYEQNRGNVLGISEVEKEEVYKYGIVSPKEEKNDYVKVVQMVEKPAVEDAPSNFSINGQYVLSPEIFSYLEKQEAGVGGEIQLTEALNKMASDNHPTHAVKLKGKRFDCGHRLGFLEANIAFSLEKPEMHDRVKEMLKKYLT